MIAGTGVDIVEISRIKNAVNRWSDKFLHKVFTDNELKYSKQKKIPYQHLAARFAAKEAVLKAFGNGMFRRVEWSHVEILNDPLGKPLVKLHGAAKKMKDSKGITDIVISMSHTRTYAVANAILVKRK